MNKQTRRIKVLHVLDTLQPFSGVAQTVMNIVQHMGMASVDNEIVIWKKADPGMLHMLFQKGIVVHHLPDISLHSIFEHISMLNKLIREKHYDIVHGHIVNSAFIYLRNSQKLQVSFRIIHFHSLFLGSTKAKRIRNWVLAMGLKKWANYSIACSQKVADIRVRQRLTRKPVVIPNGIDTDKYYYNENIRRKKRIEMGFDAKDFIIGHVGRFSPEKNHFFILDTFEKLHKEKPQMKLLLIGEGKNKTKIERVVKKRKLMNCIYFVAVQDNLNEYYNCFDVFWFPSKFEGFGLALMEAQLCGLPCICSRFIPEEAIASSLVNIADLRSSQWVALTKAAMSAQNRYEHAEGVRKKTKVYSYSKEIENYYFSILEKRELQGE